MDAHSRKELPGGEPANKRAKYEDGICHKEFKNNGVRKIQVIGCIPKIQESYENLKLMLEELDLTGVDATLCADIKLLLTHESKQGALTLFWSGGYQIDTCLPFSLYWLHGFCSESEQPDRNRVNGLLTL